MIKCVGYDIGWQVICNKCGRFTPVVKFSDLRDLIRQLGWYKLDISPSSSERIDICDICAKKHTLAQLG